MKRNRLLGAVVCGLVLAVAAVPAVAADAAVPVVVEKGAISFTAKVNVPLSDIEGKSSGFTGRALVTRTSLGLSVKDLEAWTPVSSLTTGMGIRDEHMRDRVFTDAGGKTPDVRFEAAAASCSADSCLLTGTLTFRGVTRPSVITLKIREGNGGYVATGETQVKLDEYSVNASAWGGALRVQNIVPVKFEFTAKPAR